MKLALACISNIFFIIGYFVFLAITLALITLITAPFLVKVSLLMITATSITIFAYYAFVQQNTWLHKLMHYGFPTIALASFMFFSFSLAHYRSFFMLQLTAKLIGQNLTRPQHAAPPVSNFQLLGSYTKLIANYLTHKDYPTNPHVTKLFDYTVASYSYYDLHRLVHEIFNQEIYKFATSTPQPFIIDCGSNIGISILYFKKLYPQAHIIGFEPDDNAHAALTFNIEKNLLNNITIHKKALHPTLEKVTFYTRKEQPAYPGMNMFGIFNCTAKKEISATRLSSYITKPVDFLKIDIEGTEELILQELHANHKLDLVKQLVMEFHPDKNNLAATLDLLTRNNFKYVITTDTKTPFAKKDSDNLLLIYAYNKAFDHTI